MKRTLNEIRKEMEHRGVKTLSGKDCALWGIIFAIEDLEFRIQKFDNFLKN